MSHSDYLFLKNKYIISSVNSNSSCHTQKKQIKNIQNTIIINEDNEYVQTKRFNIPIKKDISLKSTKNDKQYLPMFSIPRIQIIEYIKNRYEPPFCWTCNTPIDELLGAIACSVCDGLDSIKSFPLDITNIDSSKYGQQLFELSTVDPCIHL
jgi:hypothetical protein